MRKLIVLSGVCVVASVLSGCLDQSTPTAAVLAAPRHELSAEERAIIAKDVRLAMKDPEGAKFLWLPLVMNQESGSTMYCGFVNGKNGFGGYVGYQEFRSQVDIGGGKVIFSQFQLVSPGDNGAIDSLVHAYCKRGGYGTIEDAKT